MSLGLRESRTHQRRQRRSRFFRWLVLLALLTAGGVALYQSGASLAQSRIRQLQQETASLTKAVAEVEQRNIELMATAQQAEVDAQEWQRRYERDVPKGPTQELYAMLTGQLAAGVPKERLAFLIDSASVEQSCENNPTTKRFLVTTPIAPLVDQTVGSVSFADNAITVTGDGEPAVDSANRPEAWFDPSKPIAVHFARLGGKTQDVTSKLPLHHSVVLGDYEYRFTVTAANSRGFVNVTVDRCKFP